MRFNQLFFFIRQQFFWLRVSNEILISNKRISDRWQVAKKQRLKLNIKCLYKMNFWMYWKNFKVQQKLLLLWVRVSNCTMANRMICVLWKISENTTFSWRRLVGFSLVSDVTYLIQFAAICISLSPFFLFISLTSFRIGFNFTQNTNISVNTTLQFLILLQKMYDNFFFIYIWKGEGLYSRMYVCTRKLQKRFRRKKNNLKFVLNFYGFREAGITIV